MKKETKTSLRNRCDRLFSLLIRGKNACEWCHRRDVRLETAHIVSRAVIKLRYEPLNALCLCSGCHRKAHSNPLLFTELVKKIKGEPEYKYLIRRSQILSPISLDWYKKKLAELSTG